MAAGLARLNEEDPSFTVVNNGETRQVVLSGTGDMQLDVLVSSLKSRFNVEAELSPARVPYREKIRKTVSGPWPPQEADRRLRPVRRRVGPL